MQRIIAVLDFGAQYGHLIANRVRRLNAYSELFPHDVSPSELKKHHVAGIILSGGPQSVYGPEGLSMDPGVFDLAVPILGICYGHQLIVHMLGGKVEQGKVHEYGKSVFTPCDGSESPLFMGFPEKSAVWMSHQDRALDLPEGFQVAGSTPDCESAAIWHPEKNIFGVQFHPEVAHTEKGTLLLENFIRICGLENSWMMGDFVTAEIEKIRKQAQEKKVFLLVSGGVDSSVAFALLEKALGKERVYGLFVDHGLLRKNEATEVRETLAAAGFQNLHLIDASEQFLKNLAGVTDPEEKRRIIGDTFLTVQEQVTADLNLNPEEWLLGQGTIYPDTIETGGTKNASKIKTHHNRVPRIQEMIAAGKIIEPLKELYKDEVRAVGRKLGLPAKMIERHPFPGPGLGVRLLCAEEASPLEGAEEIEKTIEGKFSGIAAQVLPVKSVGVQGDYRSYRHPVALYTERDVSWEAWADIAPQLPNLFNSLNRVLLCVSSSHKLPLPEVEKADLNRSRIAVLQEADALVREVLEERDFSGKEKIWQFPVVLVPLHFGGKGETLILRPVESQEAMTASFAPLPKEILAEIVSRINVRLGDKISAIFYDLTNKPPGTIEWE